LLAQLHEYSAYARQHTEGLAAKGLTPNQWCAALHREPSRAPGPYLKTAKPGMNIQLCRRLPGSDEEEAK
jgi:hypothetical protein